MYYAIKCDLKLLYYMTFFSDYIFTLIIKDLIATCTTYSKIWLQQRESPDEAS